MCPPMRRALSPRPLIVAHWLPASSTWTSAGSASSFLRSHALAATHVLVNATRWARCRRRSAAGAPSVPATVRFGSKGAFHLGSGERKGWPSLLLGNERFLGEIRPRSVLPMPTLATTVDGLRLPNPFVIGSGPPGTNLSVINRAFREGWGAVIAKTISPRLVQGRQCHAPLRQASFERRQGGHRLGEHRAHQRPAVRDMASTSQEVQGRPPAGRADRVDHGGVPQGSWVEIVERCEEAGVTPSS